jgi:hypothetical protein
VGPNHYIQLVNDSNGSRFQIWDKNGNTLVGSTVLTDLWNAGGNCAVGHGDPIVLYDHLADRWMMSEFADIGNHLCIYISRTSNPVSGGWYLYDFTTPSFPDYPKYGLWTDAYYVSTYEGSLAVYALDRNNMLAGNTARPFVRFTISALSPWCTNVRNTRILPSDLDGQAPSAGTPNYFFRSVEACQDTGNRTDRLEIYEFDVDFITPTNSSFTLVNTLTPTDFAMVPCSPDVRDCIPQPGTAVLLDALTNRPLHRLQYRNFGSHQTLVTNQAVDAGGGVSGVRWYEIRKTAVSWSIFQQGTYSPDSADRWMGSAAMDKNGNIAVGYSVSSSSIRPSIRYTGRMAGDPSGTMTQAEVTIRAGSGVQTTTSRWGDYSAMSVDPVDECTYWYTNEFIDSDNRWNTHIASFSLPDCAPQPEWDFCLKDTRFNTEYWMNLEYERLLRGQAIKASPTSGFPAPITGQYDPGVNEATFSVDYVGELGLRFYRVDVGSMSGESWGVSDSDSSYYAYPSSISLVGCGSSSSGSIEGETSK